MGGTRMELAGKNAIVTGASRGLGTYIVQHLVNKGVNVALAARSAEELDEVARGMSTGTVRAVAIPTDVSRNEDLEILVEKATAELGPIDILVNNAGIEHYVDFPSAEPELIEKIMRVNYLAPAYLTRLVLPSMIDRRQGHVVNIASVAGKT